MFTASSSFFKAAKLLTFLTPTSIRLLRSNHRKWNVRVVSYFLFYWLSLSKLFDHQIVVTFAVSFSSRSEIKYRAYLECNRSRDISVGIAHWLRAGRPRGRSSSPGRVKNFIFLHVVQTGSGAHRASYRMCTGGPFPGGKAVGAWSWPLTSS
jgi:hypothetical protein